MRPGYPYPDPGHSPHFIELVDELHKTLMRALRDADQSIADGASAGERVSQIFYAVGLAANAAASCSTHPEQQEEARLKALAIIAEGMARPVSLIWVNELEQTGVFVKPGTPEH